jgi:hypothetical protein
MSYSYVKTVFPNFNYSNVYDTNLYDNLNKTSVSQTSHPSQLNIKPHDTLHDVYYLGEQKQSEQVVLPETKIETFQNNQKFYNIPYIPQTTQRSSHIEHFEKDLQKSELSDQSSHNNYTKHVLECSSCKEMLLKQFNIESDRIRNEEIMELISFIIFGIFILLLLDKSK